MKSRLLLPLIAGFSFGLVHAAAHDGPGAQHSRENNEFALGVGIGLFGPAIANSLEIPFIYSITEGAIQGALLYEASRSDSKVWLCIKAGLAALPVFSSFGFSHTKPNAQTTLAAITSICGGAKTHDYLYQNDINPITHYMQKGIKLGAFLRSAAYFSTGRDSFDITCALGSLAVACKTAYDFWRR